MDPGTISTIVFACIALIIIVVSFAFPNLLDSFNWKYGTPVFLIAVLIVYGSLLTSFISQYC